MSQLIVDNVAKSFASDAGTLEILRGVKFSLSAGESMAILGPSGSGKSTLLHILGTLDQPTAGRVLYDGQDPFLLRPDALAAFRNQKIGMVFQDHHLLPQLTVLENVMIPAIANQSVTAEAAARGEDLLQRVGLAERRHHFPAQLSGGERQRVAVARALLNHPVVLLADEPTGSLDRHTAEIVGRLLVDLQQQEKSILVAVTHSMALAELLQKRVELLDGGLSPRER